jgi:hypothetical protein
LPRASPAAVPSGARARGRPVRRTGLVRVSAPSNDISRFLPNERLPEPVPDFGGRCYARERRPARPLTADLSCLKILAVHFGNEPHQYADLLLVIRGGLAVGGHEIRQSDAEASFRSVRQVAGGLPVAFV